MHGPLNVKIGLLVLTK